MPPEQTPETYWPRTVDPTVEGMLRSLGGLLLQGARGCGKSATALAHSSSSIRIDSSPQIAELAQVSPDTVLAGETPRAIDEWQLAPNLWNAARHLIDDRRAAGQFIFAGSATPSDSPIRHSGAGRFGRATMHTMSLSEARASTDAVSFSALMDGDTAGDVAGIGGLTVPQYAELLVRGGWPALVTGQITDSNLFLEQYLESAALVDLPDEEWNCDPGRMRSLLRALARNTATEATKTRIADESELSVRSLDGYLNALRRVFILDEQPAWSPSLRSSVRLRVKPKWHLCDPALAACALGANAESLLNDLNTFGFLFESLCVHDLRVYAEALGGTVYHYRDESGLEVDAIAELRDGRWAAIEVKMGGDKAVDWAAVNLLKLANKVNTDIKGAPQALIVVTAGNVSYRRSDGVYVVALGHLRP